MIAAVAERIRSNKRVALAAAIAAGVVLIGVVAGFLLHSRRPRAAPTADELRNGKVEHVRSGSKIVLGEGEEVVFAGIRAPYADEPLFEEAQKKNEELVGGKTVRLRYDETGKDKKERFVAYVFADGVMVNEQMVRDGLAYVQLTTGHRRFEKELLAAQADARKHRRGVWGLPAPEKETQYPADPKYGNFHRPSCEDVPKIKPERLTTFSSRSKAFDAGSAPCPKCRP
jgi:micrococcal nuclease